MKKYKQLINNCAYNIKLENNKKTGYNKNNLFFYEKGAKYDKIVKNR